MSRTLTSSYLPNVHLLCVLHVAECIHGPGTVVWLAKLKHIPDAQVLEFIRVHFGDNLSIDPAVVIKDIWTDENTTLIEGMVLALLKEKGVQGVPSILAEERVLSELPIDEAPVDLLSKMTPYRMPDQAGPDSTTLIWSRLKLSGSKGSQTVLKSAHRTTQLSPPVVGDFEARFRIRSFITPWAVPIFQFRSGVELLGVIVDALTAHEQAASSCFVARPHSSFPFSFLHRDPSVLNIGMVPSEESDFSVCPHRLSGEYRGLLCDWRFAKVTEVQCHEDFCEMDEDEEERLASGDTDMTPCSTICISEEHRTDCGSCAATTDIISDFEKLVELVRHSIREEVPALEITGTRLFMAIELLVASLVHVDKRHPWRDNYQGLKHEVRQDLEAFYMVLVSLCLPYERPHARKGPSDYDKLEQDALPLCAEPALWLSGEEELNMSNIRIRFLALCTREGFGTMVEPYISNYFTPMVPFLEQIRALLYGCSSWRKGPYKRTDTRPTHSAFRKILYDAMKTIPSTTEGKQFSKIIEPPETLYCPISPKGEWQGKASLWEQPFPTQPNDAYGFVEDQVPSSSPPSAKATARHVLMPEVDRQLTKRIRRIKRSNKVIDRPYAVYSPYKLYRRRMKRLANKKGKGKRLTKGSRDTTSSTIR